MPVVEYCSPDWAGSAATNLNQLNSVISFFAAIVRNRNPSLIFTKTGQILDHLKLLPFNIRRQVSDLRFLHQTLNGRFRSEELMNLFSLHVPARRTRLFSTLHVPRLRLSVSQRSFSYRIPSLYNALTLNDKIDFTKSQNLFLSHVSKVLSDQIECT